MNWYGFAVTFLGGAIAIGGFIWQKTRNKVGTIADVREHLGRAYKGPSDSWTPAWIDGQDKPLKIEVIGLADAAYLEKLDRQFYRDGLGYRVIDAKDESVKDVARRILEPIDRATGSDAAERGR